MIHDFSLFLNSAKKKQQKNMIEDVSKALHLKTFLNISRLISEFFIFIFWSVHMHGSLMCAWAGVCVVSMSVSASVSKWGGVCFCVKILKLKNGATEAMVGSTSCLFVGVKGCLRGLGRFLPH